MADDGAQWRDGGSSELQSANDERVYEEGSVFEQIHVPEKVMAKCAQCGEPHEAEAVSIVPLGEQADGSIGIQLRYRMPVCPNTPIDIKVVHTEPEAWAAEAEDLDVPQVTEANDGEA